MKARLLVGMISLALWLMVYTSRGIAAAHCRVELWTFEGEGVEMWKTVDRR